MRSIIIVLFGILIFSSCRNKSKQKNNTVSDNMFMAKVSRVYGFKCAICHGKEGVSVIQTAPNLTESDMTLEEKVAIIKYGKTTMPPQNEVLDAKTIKGLALYIERFK